MALLSHILVISYSSQRWHCDVQRP